MNPPVNQVRAVFDDKTITVYQAYRSEIAIPAVKHQKFIPPFKFDRMTWIKPSFAWVLYRAGYGHKDKNQARILKIKLPHHAVAEILSRCITDLFEALLSAREGLALPSWPSGPGRAQKNLYL